MGDMGDFWRDVKEARREDSDKRKSRNLENAVRKLREAKVPFSITPNGVHFIVKGHLCLIDYWPTTGKFIRRNDGKTGRGINGLLKLCRKGKKQ